MNARLISLICVTAISIGCSKSEAKWIEVGYTPAMRFYLEKRVETGTKPESPFIGIEMLWDFNQSQTRPEGTYKSIVLKMLVDCRRMMAADFGYTNYAEPMATGLVVATGGRDLKDAEKELKDIQNSATKAVAESACKGLGKQ